MSQTVDVELRLESPAQIACGSRSRLYSLLAEALAFPDAEVSGRLCGGDWLADLEETLGLIPFTFETPPKELAALRDVPEGRLLEVEYIRLFEVGPGGPFCPLYEGSHRGGRMKIMEELVRFYEHFGLRPASGDQPDHICTELQFMHFLAFKQAAARDGRAEASLVAAQADFLYRHLCKWLPRVVSRLGEAPEAPTIYRALMSLASGLCSADLTWLRECRGNSDAQIGPLPD